MIIGFVACYIAISVTLAVLGRRTVVGPAIIFLVSMFLTPLIPGLYVLIARLERPRLERRPVVLRQP